MKKSFSSLVMPMAVVALFTMSSCEKEEGKNRFTATIANPTKTTIAIDEQTRVGMQSWSSGDAITVYDGNNLADTLSTTSTGNTAVFTGGNTLGSGPYHAIFPASTAVAYNTIRLTDNRTYDASRLDAPMYAYSTGTNLTFYNLCGLLRINLPATNKHIRSIEVTTDKAIRGDFLLTYNDERGPSMTYVQGSGEQLVVLNFPGNGMDCSNGCSCFIYLPPETYNSMTIEINATDGSCCTRTRNTPMQIDRGNYYNINLSSPLTFTDPDGHLNGYFSVSANKRVHFSRGNLQLQASTGTLRFALNQYDFVGDATVGNVYDANDIKCNNANISASYSGWIDLFGWEGRNMTAAPTTAPPYQQFHDWGLHYPISNGGNEAGLWHTLSRAEWEYLLFTRCNNTASSKLGYAKVTGIDDVVLAYGIVLLPDEWTSTPQGCSFTPSNINTAFTTNSITNSYTQSQWSQMEAAGAVFLPFGGYRGGTDISACNQRGYYWSASVNPGASSRAFYTLFGISSTTPTVKVTSDGLNRAVGMSVRLVREYEEE